MFCTDAYRITLTIRLRAQDFYCVDSVREQYINIEIVKLSSPSKINKMCISGKNNGLSSVARTEKVNKVCVKVKH